MPETEEVPTEYRRRRIAIAIAEESESSAADESGWVLMYVCILYVSMIYLFYVLYVLCMMILLPHRSPWPSVE